MRRHHREWIYEAKTKEQLQRRYDEWAETYDRELREDWGYNAPEEMGKLFIKYVDSRDATILDAGAGTGLGGESLKNNGYNNLFGIDMSEGMLEKARRKGIYQRLDQMLLGERLDYPDNYFDAVLSVGTIGRQHAPPESFDELIRIAKPRGLIVFSLASESYDEPRFYKKLQSLEEFGKWRLVERTEPFLSLPGESLDVFTYGFVYEVL